MITSLTNSTDIVAALGSVSSPIFEAATPYLLVSIGIGTAFLIGHYLIGLFKHSVGKAGTSGSDTDQLRRAGSDSETQAEINRQFPLM